MPDVPPHPTNQMNTVSMLGQAYSLLGFRIVDGVVGAGYPHKPKHSAVFAQIAPEGSRLTALARQANMTPQAMGELVDELVEAGYVERRPDPSDGRAKLIVPTRRGLEAIAAGRVTIEGIEDQVTAVLGEQGHRELRRLLTALLEADQG
jgi:DNA-binding MarR family transcriptional regulator